MKKNKKINISLTTKRRLIYFTIFLFICYFQINILLTSMEMSDFELEESGVINNLNFNPSKTINIDYNTTYSNYIRSLIFDVVQMLYLIGLFLMIYIHENIEKYIEKYEKIK